MTKNELITHITEQTDMKKKDVTIVLDATLEAIKETVKNGEKVTLLGFGNFEPKVNSARDGVNPATKEKIKIKASNTAKFKIGKAFKDYLN
ncbi:MAG: HU family DNA-binding protein [Mycoplasmatales bacterium]